MTDRPTGTITFLFTDIEGSTSMLERLGVRYDGVLDEHRRILRDAFASHGGHELTPQGDGCFVAFARASDAVAAALDAQLGLAAYEWAPDARPLVRMGLHSGDARLAPDGYRGLAVHQAHRVCAAAHGEQVLLSRTTRDLVASDLPDDASLLDLGEHSVRDFPEQQVLYQLVHHGIRAEFPPLRLASGTSRTLPNPRTSFIGRDHELDEARKLLTATRMLTFTGPGGAGKTRLAIEVSAQQGASRIWFAELSAVKDAAGVWRAIAAATGTSEHPDESLADAVAASIGRAAGLLVVDNCEHVIDAASRVVDELLTQCAALRVLATSREALGISGEVRLDVPPLPVPSEDQSDQPEALYDFDSIRLFCDRAALGQPSFSLTNDNTRAVVEICRRVDGIPLAIELAASRIPLLSPTDVARRLDDRFAVLSSSLRDVPARQRTLRGAIDWSFDLLASNQRLLLSRLAVFAGTFSIESVEAVCAGDEIASKAVLDVLATLVRSSLVQAEARDDVTRYRLLDSIQVYAAEKLALTGEEPAVRARHLGWFRDLAERAESELHGRDQGIWLDRLEVEHDNMQGALRWALAEEGRDQALRLATALSTFWETRGHLDEGREWLEAALDGSAPSPLRARALLRAAILARIQGDFAATRSLSEQSLALLREGGDERDVASSLTVLGSVSKREGAGSISSDSLSLSRQLREIGGITESMRRLGTIAWEEGDLAAVRELHEQSLSIARHIGDTATEADSLAWIGNVAYAAGEWAAARSRYEEALTLFEETGDRRRQADLLGNLGLLLQQGDDHEAARSRHAQALEIRREIGHRRGIAISCLNLAELARASGRHEEARALLSESMSIATELGDERIQAAVRLQQDAEQPPDVRPSSDERIAPSPPAGAGLFRREGEFWTIEFEGRTVRLKDSKGLRHLAVLLDSPGREFHVLDLVRALEGGAPHARSLGPVTEDHIDRLVVESDPFGDAGDVLDDQAKAAYRARLDELREELEEAESWGDTERASRTRAESDALMEQLAAAVGLGGRDRKLSSASERARWSVSRAIRSALARIKETDRKLGEHLEATVTTGTFCSYAPDPRAPISWTT